LCSLFNGFFDEYVAQTGIPHYKVQFNLSQQREGFKISATGARGRAALIHIAPVPIYTTTTQDVTFSSATVVATGEETSFTFTSAVQPPHSF